MATITNTTTKVSIPSPSGDGKHLIPPLTPANANSGATAPGEYKILRLKRKRHEEPLDGLLVAQALVAGESPARGDLPVRKKKHLLQGHGIFQLAETVDRREARWDDAQWRQNLQDRIVSKSQTGALVSPTKESTLSPPGLPMAVSTERPAISQRKFAILPKKRSSYIPQSPRGTNATGTPLPGPSPLAQDATASEHPTPDRRPESPTTFPLHTQELQAPGASTSHSIPSLPIPSPTKDVPMFEAVAVSSSSGEDSEDENVGKKKKKGRDSMKPAPVQEPQDEVPDEVAAFLPMLEEYLKSHGTSANLLSPANPTTNKTVPALTNSPQPASGKQAGEDSDGGEDYVWDVYYYTSQPITLSEWANMDNYGKVSILPYNDDSSDYGSNKDSVEDEADEDSNAEEWYQNDYPEEETDPSDLSDGPEDSDEDAFYDGRDDEIADDIDYDAPESESD